MSQTSSVKSTTKLVHITVDSSVIEGDLSIPQEAGGIVLFAHGAGSSRHSLQAMPQEYREPLQP